MPTSSYDQGNVVRCYSQDLSQGIGGFTTTVNGVPNTLVDPPTVMFVCVRPNLPTGGTQTPIRATWTVSGGDISNTIVHRSTGLFTADIDTSSAYGTYTYRFYVPSGTAYQASAQKTFVVQPDTAT